MLNYPRSFLALSLMVIVFLSVLPACAGAPAASSTGAPAATTSAAPAAPAKVSEYNIVAFFDGSGPTASMQKGTQAGRKALVAWWNDNRGKELGIKLTLKSYDYRYDASVAASTWPKALSSDKPIAVLTQGGPEVAALSERMPADKVAMFAGVPGIKISWLPNQWVFFAQPAYPPQFAGFVNWQLANWKESRPIRLGQISSQQAASMKDVVDGFQNAVNKGLFAGKADYVGAEWVTMTATDLSSEVKRLVDKKADFINLLLPTAPAVAIMRAIKEYKSNAKMVIFGAAGFGQMVSAAPWEEWEGHFEVSGLASQAETDIQAYKIYEQYKNAPDVGGVPWASDTLLGMTGGAMALRAIERVAKSAGADKITGEALYNAMFTAPLSSKDLLDMAPDLTYTKEVPFPITNVRIRVSTVKNGKLQPATPEWVAAPDIAKW